MKKLQPNTTTAPTGQIAPFGLRMLPELRARIEEAARTSGRSMNAEIVARLTESLEMPASKKVGLLDELQRIRENYLPDNSEGDFTVEIKVVAKPKDPAQKYMPSREIYDELIKTSARSAKKK